MSDSIFPPPLRPRLAQQVVGELLGEELLDERVADREEREDRRHYIQLTGLAPRLDERTLREADVSVASSRSLSATRSRACSAMRSSASPATRPGVIALRHVPAAAMTSSYKPCHWGMSARLNLPSSRTID